MRILFFLQPGTNSRSQFRDMIRGFGAAGHEVGIVELAPIWAACAKAGENKPRAIRQATEQVRAIIREKKFDATAAMWANALTTFESVQRGGRLESIFDDLGVPHLLFWIDAPHWAHSGEAKQLFGSSVISGPSVVHLINNPATGREMTEILGFGRTIARPYGINEQVFRPYPAEAEFDLVVSCGPGDPKPTPMAIEELGSDRPDVRAIRADLAERLTPKVLAVGERLGEVGGVREMLAALLKSQVEDRHTPMLNRLRAIAAADTSLASASAALVANAAAWVDASMTIRRIEQWERAFTISWLSRRFKVAVFGSPDHAAWESRATPLGDLAYEAMPRAYGRGAAALNVMRWQDDMGLNVKPYEITASGAACLHGRRTGLGECFEEGRELVVFDTPDGAAVELRALLDNPGRRRAIADAGLARTLRDHTWTRRAAVLATDLERVPARAAA